MRSLGRLNRREALQSLHEHLRLIRLDPASQPTGPIGIPVIILSSISQP
jgi:hypothetical protein